MSYEELSAGNSGLPSVEEDAELSPIGQLGMLSTKQMKSRAIESFICLRPSELLFLLHCLDVSNITSSTLLATSRQLSNAFSALHRTNLVEKLSRFSVVNTSATGAKYKLFQSNALDREITYIVEIDPSSKSKDPWLDLLQDTVEHAVNHTAFSRDNSSGNNGNNPSMTSLDVNSDPFFLNTSSSNQLMDIDETQAASELSSIQWLINAAKSVLKRVYEDTMIFSKADATIRELADLRHRILNKRQIVQNSLQDWKKLLQSRELLSNYKAQISLLHDLYKNRKKVLGDHWRTHGLSTPGPNSGATGSSSGSSHEVYRYPLLMNSIRILTIYSANSSSGSDHHAYMSHHHAYGASGGGNSWMKAFQWVPSDEEKERALQKMIIIQLKLEKQLQSEQSNNAVATDFNPNNSLANNFSSSTRFGTVSFSASASSSIAPSPYPSRSGGPMLSSPTRPGSFKFNGGSNDEERHSAVGEMNANSNNSHLHIPSPATGGMNPLWAIMQNVFSNNSTNAYANLQAANAVSSPPPPPPPMQLSISARAGFKPAGK